MLQGLGMAVLTWMFASQQRARLHLYTAAVLAGDANPGADPDVSPDAASMDASASEFAGGMATSAMGGGSGGPGDSSLLALAQWPLLIAGAVQGALLIASVVLECCCRYMFVRFELQQVLGHQPGLATTAESEAAENK